MTAGTRGKKVATLAVALAFSVLLLEALLRLLGAVMAPDSRADGNPAGDDAYTILCVGDSWTIGADYGTYPKFLREQLGGMAPDREYRIVNLGLAGHNSSQTLARLESALPKYQPDLVIVLTGNNDHWNLSDSSYWKFDEGGGRGAMLATRGRILLHSSRVYRLVNVAGAKLAGRRTPNEFNERSTWSAADALRASNVDREAHARQLRYNLARFVELSRAHDFDLVFQTYFHFHAWNVNEIVVDVATAQDLPLVNHTVRFHTEIDQDDRSDYVIADGHPNARGYAYMASGVLDVLRAEIPAAFEP